MADYKRELVELGSLCRSYTKTNIQTLGAYATNKETPDEIKLRAIAILLERGYGRPAQALTGEGGEGPIQHEVIIRDIAAEKAAAKKS